MDHFLVTYYLWIKSIHIIFVIAWMAGLLYLPRLFVYHTQVDVHSPQYDLFLTMERKLLGIIMKPAAILSGSSGFLLMITPNVWQKGGWIHLKILLVILLIIMHGLMHRWYMGFLHKRNSKPQVFFRVINEIPTLLMIGIVILATTKFF